jgi:hypothetical protein
MSPTLDAIPALLSLGLIVLGARSLRQRRVVGPARRRTSDWKQQGLAQLALGGCLLSIYGPGVFKVHGWTRVWIGFAGVLIAVGLFAVMAWDDYCAWDEARRMNDRN